ncbi:MAG: sodium-dependent bicarbonate transport family permease [Calditerrivibrio sp.]|nr:sodium-dependent bicarbonate transport family permease [Calditerrivibrio sp.]
MNSIDPVILFFIIGLLSGLLKSNLRLPSAIYDFLSIVLLLSIGIKGGIELAKSSIVSLLPQIITSVSVGIFLPIIAFFVLFKVFKLSRADSASIAAHYGSVSVGTYAVAVAYMINRNIFFEQHMPLLLAIMEVPAIIIGIILAKGFSYEENWKQILHDVFLGKGIVLLVGGIIIGLVAGEQGIANIKGFYIDLFKGFLTLFLLEMGILASMQMKSATKYFVPILIFGICMPIFSGVVGVLLGAINGLSVGGTAMFGVLCASASYIAVPAAMRIALPEANPTLSLLASLGVTFPFNIILGIPIYYKLAIYVNNFI